jgi:hypothetical protein
MKTHMLIILGARNILWNPNAHYRVHKNPPLFSILSQIKAVRTTPPSHLYLGLPSDILTSGDQRSNLLLAFASTVVLGSPNFCSFQHIFRLKRGLLFYERRGRSFLLALLPNHIRAACPANLILPDLNFLIILKRSVLAFRFYSQIYLSGQGGRVMQSAYCTGIAVFWDVLKAEPSARNIRVCVVLCISSAVPSEQMIPTLGPFLRTPEGGSTSGFRNMFARTDRVGEYSYSQGLVASHTTLSVSRLHSFEWCDE